MNRNLGIEKKSRFGKQHDPGLNSAPGPGNPRVG